ncbi:type II toxin-antitoxin system RelE/ParE family toxin [Bifidobacterium tsurumiense]|uniref:type II toxin-antitoxin system RelE/ParE family toxin n=1 Tax=Bifidobacterium tsurumiense TaxID=356829 RepID=UPI0012B43F7A|nr:type II toxin-antitoxin system RelE/ParE family toxin [Bifidobacterium tsurumiense]MDY4678389.1 type II toxin-antitoxin system RelE/ParE family toxin [Bifidobacterium tsurumiense]
MKTDEYEAWFRSLRDHDAKPRIAIRLRRCLGAGRPVGDIKPVGDGVFEMRFHMGPGYRVYFATKGSEIILDCLYLFGRSDVQMVRSCPAQPYMSWNN